MRHLAGLRIAAKILFAVPIVAAVGLLGTAHGEWATARLSHSCEDLVQRRSVALIALAQLNRNMSGTARDGYRIVQNDGS